MPLLRAQVTFQGGSGLAEDRFVNTFHFVDDVSAGLSAAVALRSTPLSNVYGATYTGNTIGSFISTYVARAYTIRWYWMEDDPPRVPVITTHTLPAVTSGNGLPEECAIVSSFHGSPPITARRRGRVYLGPLMAATVSAATTLLPSRVLPNIRTSMTGAFKALADADLGWVIYSNTAGLAVPVEGGWVDDALDTQRRRGPDPTVRTTWVAA